MATTIHVNFGGEGGAIADAPTGVTINPRATGAMTVELAQPFPQGDEAFAELARNAVMTTLRELLQMAKPDVRVLLGNLDPLKKALEDRLNQAGAEQGVKVKVESLEVQIADEDKKKIGEAWQAKAAATQQPPAATQQAAPPASQPSPSPPPAAAQQPPAAAQQPPAAAQQPAPPAPSTPSPPQHGWSSEPQPGVQPSPPPSTGGWQTNIDRGYDASQPWVPSLYNQPSPSLFGAPTPPLYQPYPPPAYGPPPYGQPQWGQPQQPQQPPAPTGQPTAAAKFCSGCGAKLDGNAKFCSGCGAKQG